MLISGKKNSRFAQQKKINILTLVLSEQKILNETKNPFKLNGRSLNTLIKKTIHFRMQSKDETISQSKQWYEKVICDIAMLNISLSFP